MTEIISRKRPNLCDLIVAFLSETEGAVATCTKNITCYIPWVVIATEKSCRSASQNSVLE